MDVHFLSLPIVFRDSVEFCFSIVPFHLQQRVGFVGVSLQNEWKLTYLGILAVMAQIVRFISLPYSLLIFTYIFFRAFVYTPLTDRFQWNQVCIDSYRDVSSCSSMILDNSGRHSPVDISCNIKKAPYLFRSKGFHPSATLSECFTDCDNNEVPLSPS